MRGVPTAKSRLTGGVPLVRLIMAERARVYPLRRQSPPQPRPRGPEPRPSPAREPLWREVLGQRLRAVRLGQQQTLAQTAGRAGISPQYLSEIERGRKEPSSEMIAALAGALGITLTGLTEQVAGDLRRHQRAAISRASGPVMLALAA
jgi:DNA-binding XRE family transcriptional regulator